MKTRQEAERCPIPLDSVEGWLRLYALAYGRMLLAAEDGREADADQAEMLCAGWYKRLSSRLSLSRLAFEVDEARHYGEAEAKDARTALQRRRTNRDPATARWLAWEHDR